MRKERQHRRPGMVKYILAFLCLGDQGRKTIKQQHPPAVAERALVILAVATAVSGETIARSRAVVAQPLVATLHPLLCSRLECVHVNASFIRRGGKRRSRA